MAWIELHDTLPDHPKVIDLADLLKLDKDAVVGKLVRLWTWALNSREDGFLRAKDIVTVADVMRFKGKPQRLVEALVEVQLLDQSEGGYTIHDWDEHVAMLMEKREMKREKDRLRKQRQREKSHAGHADVTRDMDVTCHAGHAVTVPKPYHTVPNSNELDNNEDKKEMDKEKASKVVRHKYGAYGNVLLSDADMEKLKQEFPDDWELRIERLSEYIASKGAKYKDHLATIRSWARKEKPNEKRGRDTGGAFDAVGTYL